MRMWNVPVEKMCNKHLLGEHVEMHMFVGCLNLNKSVEGYVNGGLVEIQNIGGRHKEISKEMSRRGMNHKSKLPGYKKIKLGNVDVEKSIRDLKKRCKECGSKLG